MNVRATRLLVCCCWILGAALASAADAPVVLQVDFARTNGVLRALHGVNKGPLGPGGLIDLTAEHRALGIPFTRLHDCYWPNPYVVDIHAVFPDFNADPARAGSYDFRLTDEYLAAVRATGAQIIYRLGESIEHTTVKRFAHPPADFEKWAGICLGIIRHYNEGWADGFHHDIRYWEIWNEPENRPAMWSGTDEDYFRLYRVAAMAIKRVYPKLKVGGPAVGASGRFVAGVFQPTAFVTEFLKLCRAQSPPLDFFSWHCYTADPVELVSRAKAIRRLLDDHGLAGTESHLNEWNYLPGNSWEPVSRNSTALARQRYYAEMAGAPGAAFVANALIELQDAPLEVANLFHGELGAFGLFNEFGVPQKNYFALRAFRELLDTPQRVETRGGFPGEVAIAAGRNADDSAVAVLVSNFAHRRSDFRIDLDHLPWSGDTVVEIRLVDARHDFALTRTETLAGSNCRLALDLPKPAIALLNIYPAAASAGSHLKITSPANRLVFQRSLSDRATIPIAGTSHHPDAIVEARLESRDSDREPGQWSEIAKVRADGSFRGDFSAPAGWYQLQVRTLVGRREVASANVERVGVGEVFIVVGHSVAQGGEINLAGALDDRVNTIALEVNQPERQREYERTADPQFLPELVGAHFASEVRPAPFGHGTYFWAQFAEQIARRENVPVLLLNAAFGGTSLEHWARSARGEGFEHSFVKASIGMPYVNLRNALRRYAAVTGVRAVLADQGQNDANEPDAEVVFNNYRAWVEQARQDLGFMNLSIVINRQTPYRERAVIREAQKRMIREVAHCFAGPDYDQLAADDRYDRIHLSAIGAGHAARLWAEALGSGFFHRAIPFQPRE